MKRSVIGLFGWVTNNNEFCSDLSVSQCCLMLTSALIGCFTVLLNVDLCSDWLFHSGAHQSLFAFRAFLNKDTIPSLHFTSPAQPGTLHLFPWSAILLLSALVYLQHLQNFWWFSWRLPRTRVGLWNDGAQWSRLLRHNRCYVLIRLLFSGLF